MKYLIISSALLMVAACSDYRPELTSPTTKSFAKPGQFEQAPYCPPHQRAQKLCY